MPNVRLQVQCSSEIVSMSSLRQQTKGGVPWPVHDVLEAWDRYGKSSSVNDLKEAKIDIVVEIASRFGDRCFYEARGMGECDAEIDLDRIKPGGPYVAKNCILSCAFHNRQRQDKSIEAYLATGLET